jgi:hypothetical protein
MVSVPVGVAVMELDCDDTVMVMRSLAPEDGVVLAADKAVAVASREAELPAVHEVIRLYRSTEPRPLASS